MRTVDDIMMAGDMMTERNLKTVYGSECETSLLFI